MVRGHQSFHLLASMTALDNVATALVYWGVPTAERRARAAAAMVWVGLGHRLGHQPAQLSGGECQRVAIARAFVGEPSLVLADEPTGNLDTRTGEEIMGLCRELYRDGTILVLITHDPAIAAAAPSRVRIRDRKIEDSAREVRT